MASGKTALPDVSKVGKLVGVATPFYVLSMAISGARVTVRARSGTFGNDDYLIVPAMFAATGSYILYIIDISNGLGRHQYYVTPSAEVMQARISVFVEEFYVWTVTFIKISLALTFLRILYTRAWRLGLYCMIIFLLLVGVTCSFIDYLQCRPTRAIWDFSIPRSHCLATTLMQRWTYIASGIFLATDVIFTCIPILMVRTLRFRLREKIAICVLMGLGIASSAANIPKIIAIRSYTTTSDPSYDTADIAMWGFLEMCIGIIAASIPALKNPLENFLKRLGLLSSTHSRERGREHVYRHKSRCQAPCCYETDPIELTQTSTAQLSDRLSEAEFERGAHTDNESTRNCAESGQAEEIDAPLSS